MNLKKYRTMEANELKNILAAYDTKLDKKLSLNVASLKT